MTSAVELQMRNLDDMRRRVIEPGVEGMRSLVNGLMVEQLVELKIGFCERRGRKHDGKLVGALQTMRHFIEVSKLKDSRLTDVLRVAEYSVILRGYSRCHEVANRHLRGGR